MTTSSILADILLLLARVRFNLRQKTTKGDSARRFLLLSHGSLLAEKLEHDAAAGMATPNPLSDAIRELCISMLRDLTSGRFTERVIADMPSGRLW